MGYRVVRHDDLFTLVSGLGSTNDYQGVIETAFTELERKHGWQFVQHIPSDTNGDLYVFHYNDPDRTMPPSLADVERSLGG